MDYTVESGPGYSVRCASLPYELVSMTTLKQFFNVSLVQVTIYS